MRASWAWAVVGHTSLQPMWRASRSSRATCSGLLFSRGTIRKWESRNISAKACSTPENSVPAMGWQPMKSTVSGRASAASITAVLTPHTSHTRAPDLKLSRYRARKSRMPWGWRARTTTSAWGSTCSARSVTRSPTPCSAAYRRVGWDTSTPTISKSSKPFKAKARDPPMSPSPMMAMVCFIKTVSFSTPGGSGTRPYCPLPTLHCLLFPAPMPSGPRRGPGCAGGPSGNRTAPG